MSRLYSMKFSTAANPILHRVQALSTRLSITTLSTRVLITTRSCSRVFARLLHRDLFLRVRCGMKMCPAWSAVRKTSNINIDGPAAPTFVARTDYHTTYV